MDGFRFLELEDLYADKGMLASAMKYAWLMNRMTNLVDIKPEKELFEKILPGIGSEIWEEAGGENMTLKDLLLALGTNDEAFILIANVANKWHEIAALHKSLSRGK
jgi:hypothetical protein|nr:MAG TPA: hypothetical protein [Caudoviricetes sp.]